jgi:pyridoxine 4-dehydrogenase
MCSLPKGPRALLFREYLPVMDPLLSVLREIAKQRRKTVPQVALNWNLQKGFLVLVGMRNVEQVRWIPDNR